MKQLRIGIAFFYHESHSFAPQLTRFVDFQNEAYFMNEDIISAYSGTKTEVGGFIDVLSEHNKIEIVPLLCAAAVPSGIVTYETYLKIEQDMLNVILEAKGLDGLLIALHGAMVVENIFDPEDRLLSKIRNIIGRKIPIGTTLDMHANLSENMILHTPLHFGFKTYPHIDMYEQGVRAATILLQKLLTDVSFYATFKKLPAMPPSINMKTDIGPMQKIIEKALNFEKESDIVNISVFGGFPYSDIPMVGASILVISTDQDKGNEIALSLAKNFWELKDEFLVDLPDVHVGMELALSIQSDRPIVLADISDNPLSCGSGDTTVLLDKMLISNIPNSLFGGLYDPESIELCRKAGIGNKVQLSLGGKTSPQFGKPLEVTATVINLSDGIFVNKGPMNFGLNVDLKGAAHIRVNEVDILLIGRAMSANDPEMFRHIGIEPSEKKILGLKVKNHFRAAFEPIVGQIISIDSPGVASNNLNVFNYKHIQRPIWPLDEVHFR